MLTLAEGVGESGEIAAYADDQSLEEFQKQQERQYKHFKQTKIPMIGGGFSSASGAQTMGG
jgi:hypothetical protein